MSRDLVAHKSRHPTLKQYVLIAIFLFLVTVVEFLIILPEDFRGQGWTIAPLVILSGSKFAAVILFYMHLKFDSRLLTWIFLGGLSLSFAVVLALMGLFGAVAPPPPSPWTFVSHCPLYHEYDHEVGACVVVEEPPVEPRRVEIDMDEVTVGRQIFITGWGGEGAATPCVTCHTLAGVPEAIGLLGPDLSHIGIDAANRKDGLSAAEYIFESIRDPEAFIAVGLYRAVPGLMLTPITAGLTDGDVEALVAFLLEQK